MRIQNAIDEQMGQDDFKNIDGDESSDEIDGDGIEPYKHELVRKSSKGKLHDDEMLSKLRDSEKERKKNLFKMT